MGFSKKVQRDVLIGCARHCCVCHRYKGIKIEVHHLVQNAKGGSNTFENAIPLCFDCHCDAGHYSSNHPRGTKFSMPELREARDKWYENVKNNSIIDYKKLINKLTNIINSNLQHSLIKDTDNLKQYNFDIYTFLMANFFDYAYKTVYSGKKEYVLNNLKLNTSYKTGLADDGSQQNEIS